MGANRLTHPYKYVLAPSVMWSHQLYVLHITLNESFADIKNVLFTMSLVFKNYSLVEITSADYIQFESVLLVKHKE